MVECIFAKNSLFHLNGIMRVMEVAEDSCLCIDCIRQTMPKWLPFSDLDNASFCGEDELPPIRALDSLSAEERKVAQERYTLISGILPNLGNSKVRTEAIRQTASANNLSRKTITNYLCAYLSYQSIAVLAPTQPKEKELSKDEKNIRWALNKFYYTRQCNTLVDAFTMMLKERYTDTDGTLLPEHPSIHQFRYFYRCYSHSCYPNYRPVANDLFLPGTSRMDVEFSSHLNEEARAVIEKMYPMEDLILEHTMFKQYARFADCNKRKTALASAISGEGNIHQLLHFPMSKNERYICYCPICAKEDRETYGEAYWHRKHLIRNIEVCPKHRCRLIPTNITATGKTSHMFEVAEVVIPYDDATEFVENDLEIDFADYLSSVFDAPLYLENTISIGVYLNYRMQGTPYLTEGTYKRQNTLLLKDFQELYHDWSVMSITKEHQLLKLLTKYRIDFYETCQVGYLLGISSDELQNPSIYLGIGQLSKNILNHRNNIGQGKVCGSIKCSKRKR